MFGSYDRNSSTSDLYECSDGNLILPYSFSGSSMEATNNSRFSGGVDDIHTYTREDKVTMFRKSLYM